MPGADKPARWSSIDNGSTMCGYLSPWSTVRLKNVFKPEQIVLAGKSDSAPVVPADLRVLLVDDNADAVETTAEILRLSGFDVAVALEPLHALELAASFKPMVAVIDIGLPVMDGYQLAAELRRQVASQNLRLIAMSGRGQSDDPRKTLAAGFEQHLLKPVDPDQLVAALVNGAQT